jgi:branched-chain amino acid transport system substrate-binding protein
MQRPFAQALTAILCAFAVGAGCSRPAEPLRIGVINSDTGEFEAFGRSVRDGLRMAVDDVNKTGGIGGRQIELAWEDDGSDAKRSAEAFKKLVDSRVLAILGPISSDGTIATAPQAAKSGIAQISSIAPSKGDAAATRNTFLIYPSTADAARASMNVAVQRFKGKRIALLHSEEAAIQTARESAKTLGVELVAVETFSRGAQDFTASIKTIAAAKPDVVIYPSFFEEESIRITNELRGVVQAAPNIAVIAAGAACLELLQSEVLNDPAFTKNLYFVNEAFGPDVQGQTAMQNFVRDFRSRQSSTPTPYAGAAYASMQILVDAINRSGGANATPAQVVDAVRSGQYQTAFGSVRFGDAGINSAPSFDLFRVANKELQLAAR